MWANLSGCVRLVAALSAVTILSSCGDDGPSSYALNTYVTGLTGTGLQVTLNGGAPISITENSQTTIARLTNGTAYTVAISAQPGSPLQTCTAANPSGTISGNNVDVTISCVTAPFQTVNANVAVDGSIPAAVTHAITTLVSPAGTVSLGTALPVSAAPASWECLVYAVDANDNIVLAAMATSNSVVLSADSTALAFVRLLLGPLPSGLADNDVDAAIRATKDYAALVTTITQSLQSGATDTASAPVLSAANMVATELPSGVLNQFAGVAGTRKQVKALSPPTSTAAPFTLISDLESVELTGATSDYSVEVANNMPIAWGFASADFDGKPICEEGESPGKDGTCTVVVAGAGVGQQLLNLYATLVGGSAGSLFSQEVPADGGTPFYLTLRQNSESRGANAVQIVKDVVSYGLTAATAGTANAAVGECVDSLVETFMPTEELGALVADPSPTAFEDYLQAIPTEFTEEAILGDLSKCLGGATAPSTHGMPQYVRITAIFFRKIGAWVTSNIGKPIQAANTALQVGLALDYWNYPGQKFGVCEGQTLVGNTIVSCAASFQFTPSSFLMSPGAVATVTLSAQTAQVGNNPPQSTAVPNDTTLSTDDDTVATVSGGPSTTVTVTAQLGVGRSTNIVANEAATGATGTLPVTVVLPTMQPASATVPPGQSVTLTLADLNGNPVIVPKSTLWSTNPSPQTVFNLDILSGLITGPGQAKFAAATDAAIGQMITVTATDPSGNSFGSAILTVGLYTSVVNLSASPTSLPTGGGTVTLTASVTSQVAPTGAPASTGTVMFKDQSNITLCANVPLVAGVATCTATIPVAPDNLTASYSGDTNYAPAQATVTVAGGGAPPAPCPPNVSASACVPPPPGTPQADWTVYETYTSTGGSVCAASSGPTEVDEGSIKLFTTGPNAGQYCIFDANVINLETACTGGIETPAQTFQDLASRVITQTVYVTGSNGIPVPCTETTDYSTVWSNVGP
jgi:hypothetical protein